MALPIRAAVECNLLERDDTPVEARSNELKFTIDPYQIRTFRVDLAP
jgi:alpha-mannosidase